MDNRIGSKIKNIITNTINHRETNFVISCLIGFVSVYITFAALFNQNVLHPFTINSEVIVSSFNEDFKLNNGSFIKNSINNVNWLNGLEFDREQYFIQTIFSLFTLWICALIFGRIIGYFYIPSLLGMIIVGIVFANVSFLNGILSIHQSWGNIIRKVALILCLIRCGIGIDPQVLKRSWIICANLGILTTTAEVLTIVVLTHFFYSFSIGIAFIFAFVLAANSPAVIVPTMLEFELEGRGTDKGIPTAMLTSLSIDNIYCITAYTILSSTIFFHNDDNIIYIITHVPIQILMGSLFGILTGILLRIFPRYDMHLAHFIRAMLLFVISCAFLFGTYQINCEIAGPVAVLIMCIVASARWKIDNHRMNHPEEKAFKLIWDLIFLPLLFVLIGLIFDFSIFTWNLLGNTLIVLFAGILVRIIFTFIVALCTNLRMKERIFLAFSFSSKASVQAVLLPFVLQLCNVEYEIKFITICCILSIIITAPIGQLIMRILGKVCLNKRHIGSGGIILTNSKISTPLQAYPKIEDLSINKNTYNTNNDNKINNIKLDQNFLQTPLNNGPIYQMSDEDNQLRLKITPKDYKKPARTNLNIENTPPPPPKSSPPSLDSTKSTFVFEEINKKAYNAFKQEKLNKIFEEDISETIGNESRDYFKYPQPRERQEKKFPN